MRKIFTFILALVAGVGTIFADAVLIDDVYYNLDNETQTAEVTYMPSGKYQGDIVILASFEYNSVTYTTTSIGEKAFRYCNDLTSVSMPSTITNISNNAFYHCTGLTSITIPNNVTTIGYVAFCNCTGLTSIEIPNNVTSIGWGAFDDCTSLTSLTIPSALTDIEIPAFRGCTGLTSIRVENGNTKYDSRDNCNAIIETASNKLVVGCKNTIIPNSVTCLGSSAFCNQTGLTSINIPSNVVSIEDYAFYSCTGLTSITCEAETPPSCGETHVFYEVDRSIPLYVPCGAGEAYADSAVWKDFTNIVEGCILTVAQAMETYNSLSLEAGAKSTKTYTIRGYVTKWKSGYPQYQNADFFIDDTETGSQVLLEAYRLNADNDADKRTLIVGDFIEATAYFKNNSGNAQLVDGTFHVITPGTPPEDKGNSSIADFISTADTKNIYHLTGTVSGLPEDKTNNAWKYGNFNLTDATGTIYIYGLLTADSVAQQFSTLDIENEDEVTLKGVYTTNNGTPQIANAVFISRTKHQDPSGLEQMEQSPMGNGKFIRDGQLFIRRGEEIFNAQGARVK